MAFDKSEKKWLLLIGILVVLAWIPIWSVPHPPLTDYPRHLFITNIIKEYNNPVLGYSNYFSLNPGPVPNEFAYGFLLLFSMFVPLGMAGKLLLSFCIALFAFAVYYFVRQTNPENRVLGLFGIALAFNTFFFIGMIDFILGTAFALIGAGLFASLSRGPNKTEFIALTLISLAAFFSHLLPFAVLLIFAFFLWFFKKNNKKQMRWFLPFLPAIMLLGWSLLAEFSSGKVGAGPIIFLQLTGYFRGFFFSFWDANASFRMPSFALIFLAFILGIFLTLKNPGKKFLSDPAWKAMLASAVFLLFLFIFLPNQFGSYWPVSARFPWFVFLSLAALIRLPKTKIAKRLLLAMLLLTFFVSLFQTQQFFLSQQLAINDYLSGMPAFQGNARILPLLGCTAGKPFSPFLHLQSYYAIEKGGTYPYLFLTPLFPVLYKSPALEYAPEECYAKGYNGKEFAGNFDEILAYNLPLETRREIAKDFRLVYSKNKFYLYRRQ